MLILANVISGWMINRQYHIEYFLIIAATASLHRLRKAEEPTLIPEKKVAGEEDEIGPMPGRPAFPMLPANLPQAPAFSQEQVGLQRFKPLWNKFRIWDLLICIGLTWLTFWTWDYILENI